MTTNDVSDTRISEWHRADSDRSILLYTLKQDGWRKGQPAMVNDLTVRIENAHGSGHDLAPIADAILAALASRHPQPVEAAEWQDRLDRLEAIIHELATDAAPGSPEDRAWAEVNALRAASIPKVERSKEEMAASLMRITSIVEGLYGFLDLGPYSPEELKENWAAWCNEKARAWAAAFAALSPSTSEGESPEVCPSCDGTGIDLYDGTPHDCQVCHGRGAPQPTPVAPVPVTITDEMVVKAKAALKEQTKSGTHHSDRNIRIILTAALSAKPTGEQ